MWIDLDNFIVFKEKRKEKKKQTMKMHGFRAWGVGILMIVWPFRCQKCIDQYQSWNIEINDGKSTWK